MPSTFTWLDYSEAERRKMLDVIKLFQEKETRDELGVGSVRDAFADTFFPGTSTIQTRARYFLFIPWMYRLLEERQVSSATIKDEARKAEVALINGLLSTKAGIGIIGEQAKHKLQRLPSSVYWQGLAVWGIRLFSGSIDQYHRSLDRFYDARRRQRASRTAEDDPLDEQVSPNWHPRLPRPPAEFPQRVTFALEPEEVEYLAERIKVSVPRSLLAFLVDAEMETSEAPFVWQHPGLASFPPELREQIEHARNFSEAIHGSALLYNLMLAELTKSEERVARYRGSLAAWADQLNARAADFAAWSRPRFWEIVHASGANVSLQAHRFIDAWLDTVCSPGEPQRVPTNATLQKLISERERQLKGKLSRLHNPRAREHWNGAAGIGQLDYRWGSARQLLADMQLARVPR